MMVKRRIREARIDVESLIAIEIISRSCHTQYYYLQQSTEISFVLLIDFQLVVLSCLWLEEYWWGGCLWSLTRGGSGTGHVARRRFGFLQTVMSCHAYFFCWSVCSVHVRLHNSCAYHASRHDSASRLNS